MAALAEGFPAEAAPQIQALAEADRLIRGQTS
jgi:hypothetical protein